MHSPGSSTLSVSVCMATYNGARYLEAQLGSILPQLSSDDELVVVDDCSTDATRAILSRLAAADPRVRVLESPRNRGVVRTFEEAIGLARKELIVLSDQDDIWKESKLATVREAFARSPRACAVLTNAEFFVAERPTGNLFFPEGRGPRLSVLRQYVRNDFIGCCLAFRRALLPALLPFPRRISMHDWWIGTNALLSGEVVFCPTSQLLYRRHQSNASPSSRRSLPTVARSRLGNLAALAVALGRRLPRPWRSAAGRRDGRVIQ